MEWETWRDIPITPEEDGETILYEVYDGDRLCGSFKILSLGINQIINTCKMWKFLEIKNLTIKRISDGQIMWSGLEYSSGGEVSS